jgi:multidrug transporter EmrE-like cation transporter
LRVIPQSYSHIEDMDMNWIILGIAISLNALANILIKVGVMDRGGKFTVEMVTQVITSPTIIGGIVSFAIALVAYGYVLTRMNLSIAYPLMTSVGFIIVTLTSWLFLKEPITPVHTIGLLFILSGVWMVAK